MPEEIDELSTENEDENFEEDSLNLKNSFERIFENYDNVARETHSVPLENYTENQTNFFNFFVYRFKNYLLELSKKVSNEFIVEMSHKQGTLMVLPYYGFAFDKQDDFFVYYLFSYDFSEMYLTLGLKVEGKNIENVYKKSFLFKKLIFNYYPDKLNHLNDFVNLKVNDLFEDLKRDIKIKKFNNENTNELYKEKNRLYGQKGTATNYENSTIFAIKYDKNNLPSNEELAMDLFNFLELYKFIKENNIFEKIDDFEFKRNLIYFGAPGTGKSFELNQDKSILIDADDNYERITFYPDYSYANFVGTYKPISTRDKKILYDFIPGPFMRILKDAIKEENKGKNFLLLIEEINRANVAAVFGDVFQLLDRDENNCSRYEIDVSKEVRDYLGVKKIKIPFNMYIWATMNSADQGVFPMDTAFKRRWDFNYLDINNNQELISKLKFKLNNKCYYWNFLRRAINKELLKENINEDKLMGPFFAFSEYIGKEYIPSLEFRETFKNKVLMYLFEDVLKSRSNKLFSGIGNKNMTFGEICHEFDKRGLEIFSEDIRECKKIEVTDFNDAIDED